MMLAALRSIEQRFASAGKPVPRIVRRGIKALAAAPEHARPRIEQALLELGAIPGRAPEANPIAVQYPSAPRELQARVVMGDRPTKILKGLTTREAHDALVRGHADPCSYLTHAITTETGHSPVPRTVSVARWLVACWADTQRREALVREINERGPHGDEIRGRLLDRVDEIADEDLARGPATGVRDVFEAAARRRYAEWEAESEHDEEPLASVPQWWRPLRCARLLMSRAALVREGRTMQHCVASYAGYVKQQRSVIVSICVRDRSGDVHRSTVEIKRHKMTGCFPEAVQHRGVGNADPHPLCARALGVLLRRMEGTS